MESLLDLQPFSMRYDLILMLAILVLPIAYYLCLSIYNIYFHPLSKYPGPRLAAATPWWFAWTLARGTTPGKLLDLHNKYGPVVRTSPNDLSFINPPQWKEIYGHKPPGHTELPKDEKYHSGFSFGQILVNADRHYHGELRKLFSHGFSDASLRKQERVIQEYVDMLFQKLHENSQDGQTALDLTDWYNFFTFDLIGFLTFGESFNCLNSSLLHSWIRLFFSNIRILAFSQAIARLPRLLQMPAKMMFIPKSIKSESQMLWQLNEEKVKYRLEQESTIPDFMDKLIDAYHSGKMSFPQLAGNAQLLVVAGSETTATLLSGLTYLLLQNRDALERLTREVRETFGSPQEITITGVNSCKYLNACIEEALRVYPPSPQPHQRIIPAGGAMINGELLPEGTSVSIPIYAASNSPENWTEPNRFIPERWSGEDARFHGDRREVSQPFSFGPRNCIGRNLAYVEMKIIIARLVWHFDLENTTEGNWLDQKVYMVWEKSPLWVKLHPVQRA
ncbi:cytochrome P450 [Xylariaceae sp. FL1651]|nr:cytochrome P450 [Xylariaceae sp. FL1651]